MKNKARGSGSKQRKRAANLAAYENGALIFSEGERGDAAYRIVSGHVGLLKRTDAGLIHIERLSPPALFGETGILDQSRRTVSARAIGDVTVEVIHRETFLESVRRDPEQALSMMSTIAERAATPAKLRETSRGDVALAGWLSRFLSRKPKPLPIVEVRIPGFAGENGDTAARSVMAGLERFSDLKVRAVPLPNTFPDEGVDDATVSQWAADARQLLCRNGGDVLVWGKVTGAGAATRVRLVSTLPGDEDLPGNFTGFAEVPLGYDPDENDFTLLRAAILAATVPQAGAKTAVVQAGLTDCVDAVKQLVAKQPRGFTPSDRLHLILAGAHILATAVQRAAAPLDAFRSALEYYKQALDMMPGDAGSLGRGLALKNIGASLVVLGERDRDDDRDAVALETMSAACNIIPRDVAPREWAAAHNRLGQILYRLDLAEADAEMKHLKRSLAAFRAAMQVYTRVDAPERWADVMNNYAQAAQVLGGNLHNAKILQNSVQACRNALEVRRRDKSPQLWASTQNTLGSGLFLLGKVTRRADILHSAVDALEAAHAVYAECGAAKMASVIARNLGHVRDLIEDIDQAAIEQVLKTDPDTGEVVDDAWWKANVVDEEEAKHHAVG